MDDMDVKRRASRFLKRAERLIRIAGDRPLAFQAIFGYGGLYISTFPTHEDRMTFRDVPLARAKLFSLLGPVPEDAGEGGSPVGASSG